MAKLPAHLVEASAVPPEADPFGQAETYRELGWPNTLPLPYRSKQPPPSGFTGAGGRGVTARELQAWGVRRQPRNLALRLQRGVVGIDVDAYKAAGAETFEALTAELGPLPPTHRSSSRGDGRSGIYWFRVPESFVWETGDLGPGVEVVHHGHRYAVVWPSLHPDGGTYLWFDATGERVEPPRLDDLAELTEPWLLRGSHSEASPVENPASLDELLSAPPDGPDSGRNNWLTKVAGHYAVQHKSDESAYFAAVVAANESLTHPLSCDEAEKVAASIRGREAKKAPGKGNGKGPSRATILVEDALGRYDLLQSPEGTAMAVPKGGPNLAKILKGTSNGLRSELGMRYFEAYGEAVSASDLSTAVATLEGFAQRNGRRDVSVRLGRAADGPIVLDLGQDPAQFVRVTQDGWAVEGDSPGLLFRRTALTSPMPIPEHGGDVRELAELLNVGERDWPLFVGWLVSALVPDIPHPVLLLEGEQGSGKSTAQKFVAALLDRSPAANRSSPRDLQEWVVAVTGSWVVPIDNVSSIPDWFSDSLCRAVTGDAMVRRELYTDDGLKVNAFRRVVVIDGIDVGSLRGDLADRMIRIELSPIGAKRLQEKELAAAFEAAAPRILGGLLDLLCAALALPPRALPHPPRMADFASLLDRLDRVLGTDSLKAYEANRLETEQQVVFGDPVASAVARLMEAVPPGPYRRQPTELLADLDAYRPEGYTKWPRSAKALSGELKRLSPALRSQGITVLLDLKSSGKRYIELIGTTGSLM